MSQENVEAVRTAFDAFSRDDWDALIGLLDPEIEWVTTGQFVGGQVYRGHAGVRDFLEAWAESSRHFVPSRRTSRRHLMSSLPIPESPELGGAARCP